MKWPMAVVAIIISTTFLFGQQDLCGTMVNVQHDSQADAGYAKRYNDFISFLKSDANRQIERSVDSSYPTIYIPVVFHIIYNNSNGPENISDAQVLSQIDALNRDFNYQPGQEMPYIPEAYKGLVTNANIKFCMAQFDPAGNVTTGIDRLYFPETSWDTRNEIDSLLKPLTIWNNLFYLNVWSVIMGGDLESSGWLAYSSLPPDVWSPTTDGVAARYDVIGTTGNLLAGIDEGKTVSHEVGHWLGLFHTFQDGCPGGDSTCATTGDYICDTPPEAAADYGCPTFPNITCNNGPNGDMYMNFMDYSTDACRGMFTPQQVDRMHSTINTYRPRMLSAANGCFYQLDAALNSALIPTASNCSLTFTPTVLLENKSIQNLTSGVITYQMDGSASQTINWTGSMATGQVTELFLPSQTVTAGSHKLLVIFNNADGLGPDYNPSNDTLNISFNAYDGGNSLSLPFAEGFEGTFPENGWSLYNPTNDSLNYWKQNSTTGAYGTSSKCIWMNNLGYHINPRGLSEGVVTANYDFSTIQYPQLNFDEAYAQYSSSRTDSLKVFYSINCGTTWVPLWQQSGAELATAPNTNQLFQPNDTQWRTVNVPLLNLVGIQKVSFLFVNLSGAGNAMYLDNIDVVNNVTLSVPEITKVDVRIYPNPASNTAALRLPSGSGFKKLQVFNELGQMVYETNVTDGITMLSTQTYATGMYLVQLTGDNISQTEKLMIAR